MFKLISKLGYILFLLPVLTLGCDDPVVVEDTDDVVTINIHDHDYIKRQFYYLETPGDDPHHPEFGFGMFYPVIGGRDNDSLEVFISLRPDTEWNNYSPKYYAEAWTDPNNDGDLSDGDRFISWFYMLINRVDYDLVMDYGNNSPTPKYIGIRLRQPLPAGKALAVRYRMRQNDITRVTVGDYGNFPVTPIEPPQDPHSSLTIYAELICPPEEDFAPPSIPGARYTSTWNMMFRNVYAFDFSSIYPEYSWKAEIWSVGAPGGDSKADPYSKEKYLRLFGLDRYLSSGDWGNDGYIDVRQGIIDFYNGYLMLPSLTPFDVSRNELAITFSGGPPDFSDSLSSTLVDSISANLVRNSEIYDQIISVNSPPNKYDIVIELRKYDGD